MRPIPKHLVEQDPNKTPSRAMWASLWMAWHGDGLFKIKGAPKHKMVFSWPHQNLTIIPDFATVGLSRPRQALSLLCVSHYGILARPVALGPQESVRGYSSYVMPSLRIAVSGAAACSPCVAPTNSYELGVQAPPKH